jgi:hypothetical protein
VPIGAYRIEPYPFYREWHAEVVECAGEYADFDALEFWAVPARAFRIYGAGTFAGYYDRLTDPDRIYLVEWDLENEGLVKHEMLHQVADSVGAHPIPPYDHCAPRMFDGARWRR